MMARRTFKLIAQLPRGDWRFLLVRIQGAEDVVVVVDKTGQNEPRLIIGGEVVKVSA